MKVREILKTLREERKKETKKVNENLKTSREWRGWDYVLKRLRAERGEEIRIVKGLVRGKRYTSWETKAEEKEGSRFSKYFVDREGNGVEIVYEFVEKKVCTLPDDYGEDYGTGFGRYKELPSSRDYEYRLEPEIVEVRKVSGIEIPNDAEFVYLPEFNKPERKPAEVDISRLKKIEKLIDALEKLPENTELSIEVEVNRPENPEEVVKLIVDFDREKLLYYKVEIDEYWEYADYFDIPEEIHDNTEIAEEIGQKIVESLENGIIPDIDNIVKQEIENFFFNKERERLIEKGQSLADEKVVEKIDKEYREKIISLLIGQKVKEDVEYLNKKLEAGETITEDTEMGILIPIFIFPHKYLSDKEVADTISNLWEERKQKIDDYYISLALNQKGL